MTWDEAKKLQLSCFLHDAMIQTTKSSFYNSLRIAGVSEQRAKAMIKQLKGN